MNAPRLHTLSCAVLLVAHLAFSAAFSVSHGNGARRPFRRSRVSCHAQSSASSDDLWQSLLERFQGDFDNYNQVVEDRAKGMLPREGGGHENIHCSLIPVAKDARLAAFYFEGTPEAIFRFRYYHLVPVENETAVDTILYTLNPALEGALRQAASEPHRWPTIFQEFEGERIKILPKCDVRWSWELDPIQHAYVAEHSAQTGGIHAVMVHGSALVESQQMPGQRILIYDQLSLWDDGLWIHDRGLNPDTGAYIYGNQLGIPYILERVARTQDDGVREIVNPDLKWTLGPKFRTDKEYQEKLDQIGGASRPPVPGKK